MYLHVTGVVCDHAFTHLNATCRYDDWPSSQLLPPLDATQSDTLSSRPTRIVKPLVRLLIGIKTSVLHGTAARRAIRSTWANRAALPVGVRVVFLGCAPDFSDLNGTEATQAHDAILAEQERYDGDLLIDQLVSCRDAYDDLVNKVLAFFQWSADQDEAWASTSKSYVMVADDDIYVRVDRLLSELSDPQIPASRFYGGQVWAQQFRRAMAPHREPPTTRYYLSRDHYALDQLPPFANGPHYLLSTDVAHFIGKNRVMFRGVGGDPLSRHSVGTLDDVSVALWVLAMQIHPHHFDRFISMRDTMCANDFVSFADLTPLALARVHANIQQNRSACVGFSYATWFKRIIPKRTQRDLDDDPRRLEVWNTLKVDYQVERLAHTDNIEVFIKVQAKDTPSLVPVEVKFVPAIASFFVFCTILTDQIAERVGVLAGQPVFICELVRTTLRERMLEILAQHPSKRPIAELLIHNLGHTVVAPHLKIAPTSDTKYARVVIENLLAQAYESAELQVVEEETYRQDERDPDIVVFTTIDAPNDTVANAIVDAFALKYKRSRLVLLHPRDLAVDETLHERVIVVASTRGGVSGLYLPMASSAFGSSRDHSPVDLLQSFDTRAHSSSTHTLLRLRPFCIDDYAPHQCDHPHRQYFSNLLNALDGVDVAGACPHVRVPRTHTLNESITMTSAYALDLKVDRFADYKFTIAFEDAVNVPGQVGDTIVAAFLAGSIPIYYGHSATITQLFNRKAFIDCGAFASLRVCATHVLAVHASPSLYDAMRREVPVVNSTAFQQVFSWHPDVVDTISQTRVKDKTHDLLTLGEQFKRLLDNAK